MIPKHQILVTKTSAILAILAFTATILLALSLSLLSEFGATNDSINMEAWILKALVIFAVMFLILGRLFASVAVEVIEETVTEHKVHEYLLHKQLTPPVKVKEEE